MYSSTFMQKFLASYQAHALMIFALLAMILVLRWLPSGVARLQRLARKGSARVDPGLHEKEVLEWTYKLRNVILSVGGLSLSVALGAIVMIVGAWSNSPHPIHLTAMALWLTAIVLMGGSLAEGVAPWFHSWFRSLAWNLARIVVPLRDRLRDLWLWSILALVALGLANKLLPMGGFGSVLDRWLLPSGTLLVGIALLHMAFKARRRIVIQSFSDPEGEEKLKGVGAGLAIQLRHELSRIQSLYETVDEVLPENQKGTLSLSMHVQDVGEIFKDAVGPDSKIAIGPVKIPISAIVSALGMFISGPRITGSLHREGTGLALLAEIGGGGQSRCWKVTLSDGMQIQATLQEKEGEEDGRRALLPPKGEGTDSGPHVEGESSPANDKLSAADRQELDLLVRLLACRIFASLVPNGSPRWQAVHHFTAGLHAYRETQRTERNKFVHLRRAEKEFLRALSDDNTFSLCQCDLGVVYRELRLEEAEEAALRQALAQNPHAVDVCMGLAVLSYGKSRYPSAVRHCENALRTQADRPEIWNLLGWARAAQECQKTSLADALWVNRSHFEIATALAWRSLFRISWLGRPGLVEKHRNLASYCLRALASAWASAHRTRQACRLYRQALCLGKDLSLTAFELGKILFSDRRWKEAEVAFARIFNNGLADSDLAELGLLLFATQLSLMKADGARGHHWSKAEANRAFFLDQLAIGSWSESGMESFLEERKESLDPSVREELSRLMPLCKAVSRLQQMRNEYKDNESDYLSRLTAWKATLRDLKDEVLHDSSMDPELRGILSIPSPDSQGEPEISKDLRKDDLDWLYAQVGLHRTNVLLERKMPQGKINITEEIFDAVDNLYKRGHQLQIRKQGLYGELARAYLYIAQKPKLSPSAREKLLQQALIHAEKAVEWNPQGPRESFILGSVYTEMGDWRQASEEWERTLDLGHDSEILKSIASIYFPEFATRADRRATLPSDPERVHRFLCKTLDLVESMPLGDGDGVAQVEAHACLHFCVGRSHFARKKYEKAIKHLRIARNLGFRSIEARVTIADAWLEIHGGREEEAQAKARYEIEEAEAIARHKEESKEWQDEKERRLCLACIAEVRRLLPGGKARKTSQPTPQGARKPSVHSEVAAVDA